MATNFDDLSRALATGVSRKHALKLLGAAIGGGIAAVMRVDRVGAAPDPCQVFCGKNANISGPEHAACIQACHQCNADLSRLCFGPTSITCCAPGSFCINGTCAVPAPCVSGGTGCNTFCGTSSGNICACVTTAEGSAACVQEACTFTACTASSDCGPGAVCFTEGCCGTPGGFCVPTCS